MCRVLKVSRAGYYAWRERELSQRAAANIELVARIREIHRDSRGTYGSPRIHAHLACAGVRCSKKRVARLMRSNGIVGAKRRLFRLPPDERPENFAVAPNLVERNFAPGSDQHVWVADFTYVPTSEGFLHLAIVLALRSRKVIGWSMSSRRDAELVIDALQMAIGAVHPRRGTVVHTDQGSQYACKAYRRVLKRHGLRPSMSRKGNCWDNAVAESFFATLKLELGQTPFGSRAAARRAIFEYIEVWYNRQRRHTTLGCLSPAQFEGRGEAA